MKKGWLVVISLVAAIALLGAVGYEVVLEREGKSAPAAVTPNTQQMGVWVTGQGRVSVTPDIAVAMLGVEARADTVSEAMNLASAAMDRVLAALREGGVAEEDIQTFHFSIHQVREWVWRNATGEEKVTGYLVSNMVHATIRALDEVGVIIAAVVEAGGDLIRIHGISFTVEDPTPYHYEAREKAFADAKAKAEQLARLAGVTLGKATYISEGMVHFPPMPVWPQAAFMVGPAAVPPPPPIMPMMPFMPGELEIIIHVQVVFPIE
jgi:uncharacterized protein YggE